MTSASYSDLSSPLLEHPSIRKVELVTAVAVGDAANYRRSSSSNIPEALGLRWTDTFYDSTEGVIAVFDIDHKADRAGLHSLLCFYTYLCVLGLGIVLDAAEDDDFFIIAYGIWCVISLCLVVLFEVRSRRRGFDRMHVAVTNEGIRNDIGVAAFLTTMVIPFEEIKAINYRCGSSIVTVRSSVDCKYLFIAGLKDPEAFIALVNAMMARSQTPLEHPSIRKVELVTAVAIGDAANHRSSISPIPEALDLTWTDTFYDSTEGVIAVFDIDHKADRVGLLYFLRHLYALGLLCLLCSYVFLCVFGLVFIFFDLIPDMVDRKYGGRRVDQFPWQTERRGFRGGALYKGIFKLYSIFCVILICWAVLFECRARRRRLDRVHVAVTNEGIRKDFDKCPSSVAVGAAVFLTTVIPFEEIKAINYSCGSSIVTVRSSVDCTFAFIDLKDPEAFIALVNAMMARSHTVSVLDEESLTEM